MDGIVSGEGSYISHSVTLMQLSLSLLVLFLLCISLVSPTDPNTNNDTNIEEEEGNLPNDEISYQESNNETIPPMEAKAQQKDKQVAFHAGVGFEFPQLIHYEQELEEYPHDYGLAAKKFLKQIRQFYLQRRDYLEMILVDDNYANYEQFLYGRLENEVLMAVAIQAYLYNHGIEWFQLEDAQLSTIIDFEAVDTANGETIAVCMKAAFAASLALTKVLYDAQKMAQTDVLSDSELQTLCGNVILAEQQQKEKEARDRRGRDEQFYI